MCNNDGDATPLSHGVDGTRQGIVASRIEIGVGFIENDDEGVAMR